MSKEKSEIVLIDLSAIFRTCWHANENNETSYAVGESKRMISRAIGDRRNRLVVVAADGAGSFRKKLEPSYKANREKQPQTMYGALDMLKEDLLRDGELIWTHDGFEADDVIASATDAAFTQGHEVVIVSHDKDLLQLLKPGVRALRIGTWELVDHDWVKTKFGVPPTLVGDFLAITGDKVDNVSGIEGAGPVAAAALLNHFGGLRQFLASVAANGVNAIVGVKPLSRFTSVLSKFIANKDAQARLVVSRTLIELRYDVPIKWEEVYAERGQSEPGEVIDADFDDEPGDMSNMSDAALESIKAVGESIRDGSLAEKAMNDVGVSATTPQVSEPVPPPPVAPTTQATPVQASTGAAPAPASPGGGGGNGLPRVQSVPMELQVIREQAAIREKELVFSQFGPDLQPTGMAALYWLARRAIETKSGKYKNADEALMVMLRGQDFKVRPAMALDIFHVIEGKPCPPASLLIASAQAHPDCEYLIPLEFDNQHAVYRVKHRKSDKETTVEYTIHDAMSAQLIDRINDDGSVKATTRSGKVGTWQKFTRDMLMKSCGLKAGRWFFPGAMLGAYAYEEMPEGGE